ncbi:hypothetical protein HYALB_00012707 [Hymenoscyphus albidus]|uniref:Uncharacterized protein n=1 Tax=Hymenoscyphus albidus TaxID=595503 RepID=A0A9N9LPK5_9HELO|nr:hypothetical protein HYALB_00012707 [Hymenoscyphus albidus]
MNLPTLLTILTLFLFLTQTLAATCDQAICDTRCNKAGVLLSYCNKSNLANCICNRPGDPGYGLGPQPRPTATARARASSSGKPRGTPTPTPTPGPGGR